jgi:hypothetical protein
MVNLSWAREILYGDRVSKKHFYKLLIQVLYVNYYKYDNGAKSRGTINVVVNANENCA